MERIKYIDCLKFLAIFSIVALHSFAIFNNTEILNIDFRHIKECVRFGVPLFLMITGSLAFKHEIHIKSFLKKKTARIVYPLIFFMAIIVLLNQTDNIFSKYWFCWMIIGVYLAIPVINKYIMNSSIKEIEYFTILFLITSLIYTIASKSKTDIALDLNFFIGPISYVILGYYLSKKDFNISANKMVLISMFTFILVTLYKILNNDYLYVDNHFVLFSLLNLSIPQIIQASSVFLMIKYLYQADGMFGKIKNLLELDLINNIFFYASRSSYGIYLIHTIFLYYIKHIFKDTSFTGTTSFLLVIPICLILFISSWLIILALGRIPYINKLSGYY